MNYTDNMNLQTAFMGGAFLFSVGNFFLAALFWRLRGTFVSKKEAAAEAEALREEMKESVAALRKENAARFDGIQTAIVAFDGRLRKVEQDSSGMASEIHGVMEVVTRVDRMTMLMIEFRMKEGGDHG